MVSGRKAPGRGAYDGLLGMRPPDDDPHFLPRTKQPYDNRWDNDQRYKIDVRKLLEWLLAIYDFDVETVERIKAALKRLEGRP